MDESRVVSVRRTRLSDSNIGRRGSNHTKLSNDFGLLEEQVIWLPNPSKSERAEIPRTVPMSDENEDNDDDYADDDAGTFSDSDASGMDSVKHRKSESYIKAVKASPAKPNFAALQAEALRLDIANKKLDMEKKRLDCEYKKLMIKKIAVEIDQMLGSKKIDNHERSSQRR